MVDYTNGIFQLINNNRDFRKSIDFGMLNFSSYVNEFSTIRFFVGRCTGNTTIIKNIYDKNPDSCIILVHNYVNKQLFEKRKVFTPQDVESYKLRGLRFDTILVDNPSLFDDYKKLIVDICSNTINYKDIVIVVLGT